jgi:transcriptional regulator with XRE-family HTH domain
MRRDWLITKRKALNLRQQDVATSVGIARSHYMMIEIGERDPSPDVAIRIASELHFRWTRFFAHIVAKRKKERKQCAKGLSR